MFFLDLNILTNRNIINRELYIEVGIDGVIIEVSPNCVIVLGYEPSDIIGKKFIEIALIDIQLLLEKIEGNMETYIQIKKANGEIIYMDCAIVCENNKFFISMIDVTRFIKDRDRNERVLQIFEKSKDIIYSLDIKPEVKYVYLNPAIEKSLGYTLEENLKNPFIAFEIVHPEHKDIQMKKLNGDIECNQSLVTMYKHKITGEYIWFEDYCMPFYNEDGELIRIDGICRNIQDRKELEERLKYLSYHDALTGLCNRTYFEEQIKCLDEKKDTKVGIVICDLDNLKYVNDKLGHFEGDQLIKSIAEIIKNSFEEKFVASRFGGDEFVIVLEDLEKDEMKKEVQKFKNNINSYNSQNPTFPIQVSMGFAFAEHSQGNVYNVFKKADKNMFREKLQTKNFNYCTDLNFKL